MTPRKRPVAASAAVDEQCRLNELARLYPWTVFTQRELRTMTGLPEGAISAAFADPVFPQRFEKARPESLMMWVEKQEVGVVVKGVKPA